MSTHFWYLALHEVLSAHLWHLVLHIFPCWHIGLQVSWVFQLGCSGEGKGGRAIPQFLPRHGVGGLAHPYS